MKVTVIDYGLSNLLSVERALTHLGAQVEITGPAPNRFKFRETVFARRDKNERT